MRTQDTRQQSRRSHRGPRRHNRRGGYNSYNAAPRAPERKKTLWEKIKDFFTGKTKTASGPANGSAGRRDREDRSPTTAPRAARKPEVVEVNSPKIYVGNLSFDAVESDLFDLFNGVGQVQNAEIVSHKYTQKSKGFAFVTMASIEEAKRAVEVLHDKEFMGRKLVVSGAKTSDVRN